MLIRFVLARPRPLGRSDGARARPSDHGEAVTQPRDRLCSPLSAPTRPSIVGRMRANRTVSDSAHTQPGSHQQLYPVRFGDSCRLLMAALWRRMSNCPACSSFWCHICSIDPASTAQRPQAYSSTCTGEAKGSQLASEFCQAPSLTPLFIR